jgi:LmbE family N-acetylglucosaminyl deacetylase
LLVLAPHADDESIGPGGLLLAHRGRSELHILNVFTGAHGGRLPDQSWVDDSAYRAALDAARQKELKTAARLLGAAAVHSLGLADMTTVPSITDAKRLREIVDRVAPDVVLLPWFLDNQRDHRATNVLYAWGCRDVPCMVLGYEIWTLCQPNAVFDITPWLEEKVALVETYQTQVATTDYASYVRGLAHARAFLHRFRQNRSGAAEALLALPGRDYCDVVCSFYGEPGCLSAAGLAML